MLDSVIPPEVLRLGSKRVVQYLLDLYVNSNAVSVYRCKLMVVGYAEIGKTTILDCLFPLTATFDLREKIRGVFQNFKRTPRFFRLQGTVLSHDVIRVGSNPPPSDPVSIDLSANWRVIGISVDGVNGFRLIPHSGDPIEVVCPKQVDLDVWLPALRETIQRQRTHGIDVKEKVPNHPVIRDFFKDKPNKELELSVWDFAGQHDYYNNHQHFLSIRSVFLVLWKANEFGQEVLYKDDQRPGGRGTPEQGKGLDGLHFWFSSLAYHLGEKNADNYSIVVVGTHLDQAPEAEIGKRGLAVHEIASRYKLKLSHCLEVSCTKLTHIGDLQDIVFGEILQMKFMGEQVPKVYLDVERDLQVLRAGRSQLPIVNIANITPRYQDPKVVERALSFLSQVGRCVYFENDPELSRQVVLDPHFLSKDTLAALFSLDDEAKAKRRKGIVQHSDFKTFFAEVTRRYNYVDEIPKIVRLMERFDVCFVLPEDRTKPFFEQRSVIPSLLPFKPIVSRNTKALSRTQSEIFEDYESFKLKSWKKAWPETRPPHQCHEMERFVHFSVVPAELVASVVSRFHHLIHEGCVWRNFVLLIDHDAKALAAITVNIKENLFAIEIRGESFEGCISLLEQIHDVFDEVSKKKSGGEWWESVRSLSSSTAFIRLKDIVEAKDNFVECPETQERTPISRFKVRAGLEAPQPQDRQGCKLGSFAFAPFVSCA